MKLEKNFRAFSIIFLISSISIFCQRIEVIGNVDYGISINNLGNNKTTEKGSLNDILPDDIEIDYENNIYICDKYTKKILKYSKEMKYLLSIELTDDQLNQKYNFVPELEKIARYFFPVKLETDSHGNLYALVCFTESFHKLLKFDRYGNNIIEFEMSIPFPSHRVIDFFISQNDRMYINTFPFDPTDMRYINDGLVYVYDLEGKFINRTDYFIEDKEGKVYIRNLISDKFQIDVFRSGTAVKQSNDYERVGEMKINYTEDPRWKFIGIDNTQNIYFMQGDEDLVITIFNYNENSIKQVIIENEKLNALNILFANYISNISVSPSGEILVCGLKNNTGRLSVHSTTTIMESQVSIIKLDLNLKD